jgi:hypothetical protein
VREVKFTQLHGALVATVEFFERVMLALVIVMSWYLTQPLKKDNIPAALTKDKKRLRGEEIGVHLAWKSTLYVTNFPESTDDAAVRKLFGQVSSVIESGGGGC